MVGLGFGKSFGFRGGDGDGEWSGVSGGFLVEGRLGHQGCQRIGCRSPD